MYAIRSYYGFYGMILQATSGMGMYNVRLEEAGGLLIRLGQVLGVITSYSIHYTKLYDGGTDFELGS